MRINKFHHTVLILLSVFLICTALYCVIIHTLEFNPVSSFDILAAELTMPTGNAEYSESSEYEESQVLESSNEQSKDENTPEQSSQQNSSQQNSFSESNELIFQESSATAEEIEKYDNEHEGEEKYPVNEINITEGNESYENVQVKNASSTDIDIESELNAELGFSIDDTDEPQVLIYHTHTCESFLTYDTGYYYETFYPRTTDSTQNVCAVGEEIANVLNANGIVTIHDTTLHDSPSYNGAYDRSLETINSYLEKYPSIKVVLDIHRDGIGTDTEKSKPIFTVDGKKAAQIMILAGYEYDSSLDFDDWEYNLRFALQIQNTAESMYPGMARPLYFNDFMYNMNVNTGSLLIEIGSDSNTLEEVRYSGYLLGNVLSEVLKNNMSS